LCNIVALVIFPVFAKIKDDVEVLGRGFLQTAQYVALFTVPAALGLALLAKPFVLTFFGEKWIDVVPVMQAISIYTLLISLGYNAGDVYKAQGRSEILSRIALFHAIILVPTLMWVITMTGNIVMVGWAQAFVAFVISSVYLIVALRILKLSPGGLLGVLKVPFIPALGMSLSLWGLSLIVSEIAPWLMLSLGIFVGASIYMALLWILDRQVVNDALDVVRSLIRGKFVEAEI
jgi:O-antigen/teichoic acid export membrane protein